MRQQGIETLVDRWMNDPAFREQLRSDPEAAVQGTGVALSAEEWAALRAIDWSATDEELQSRVSRAGA